MGMKDKGMSFFVTSMNPGKGADLGGLAGADAHCAALAQAAGSKGKNWKAYLSSSQENARDRIGKGPWMNAKGVVVATSVENLLSDANNLTKDNAIDEKGMVINGRGDTPNRHDMMTASNAKGMLEGGTCNDWTSSGEGSVLVGHHDRVGGGAAPTSWSSAHPSRACGMEALRATGGEGLYYCFAAN
ncbi:hypothetical protein LPB72_05750 [Hydrogenophaga crassostreae]|uniref:Lectin n=2 Tax=Hydrogenophaga crassostreae TaxID=1763535 RepID=A0A167IQV1_9BURK|nr:hypothetical protein LPB072_18800 [Hydrogenophaga crassostreae]OAD43391.1 hypothetical protein LPB72_05750 [Hydrogenophaga crassostreae]